MKKKSHTRNPRTNRQFTYRLMFAWLAKEWALIGPAARLTWEPLAKDRKISPYNAYMAFNCERWLNYKAPSQTPNAAEVLSPSNANVMPCSFDGEKFICPVRTTAILDGWGYVETADDIPAGDVRRSISIIIHETRIAHVDANTWAPANPVSTRFRCQPFSVDGRMDIPVNGWNVFLP